MFRDKRPIKLPCTTLEQGLERRSHRPLMRSTDLIKLIQRACSSPLMILCVGLRLRVSQNTFHVSRFPPAIAHVAPLGL